MKVDVSIGALTLDGVTHGQRHHVATAMARELERLLTETGVPPAWRAAGVPGRTKDSVAVQDRALRPTARPSVLGRAIGRAVFDTEPTRRGLNS